MSQVSPATKASLAAWQRVERTVASVSRAGRREGDQVCTSSPWASRCSARSSKTDSDPV